MAGFEGAETHREFVFGIGIAPLAFERFGEKIVISGIAGFETNRFRDRFRGFLAD